MTNEQRIERLERIVELQQQELTACRKLFRNHQGVLEQIITRMGGEFERGPEQFAPPSGAQN